MGKDKLFTPEDFDKPGRRRDNWKKIILIVILIVVILGLVTWTICSYMKKGDLKSDQNKYLEQLDVPNEVDDVSNDSDTFILVDGVNYIEDSIPEVKQEEFSEEASVVNTATNSADIINAEAMKVIRGEYGNIPKRKKLLGSRYQEIQSKVNQLKKDGAF